jgi:hypothetical protein
MQEKYHTFIKKWYKWIKKNPVASHNTTCALSYKNGEREIKYCRKSEVYQHTWGDL